jgi:hypothetical protein
MQDEIERKTGLVVVSQRGNGGLSCGKRKHWQQQPLAAMALLAARQQR